jgi:hypothetical protein
VGPTLITQRDADAFSTVLQYYPNPPEEFYLGAKSQIEAIVAAEAIYRKTRWNLANLKIRNSLAWKWRERYYVSTLFTEKIVRQNFGFTDRELRKYYNNHKQDYASVTYDTTGKACTTGTPQPFEQVRIGIAEKLFLATHPPDSAFKTRVRTSDTNLIVREWLRFIRGGDGVREVFLKRYFKEKYGSDYPDSLDDYYGKGKIITPDDMDIMISWLPANRREQMKGNRQGMNDLAHWLLRWKVFSERAAGTGYASQPAVQNTLKWVWRLEIAQRFVNKKIVPTINEGVRIDTAMAVYAYWDETETSGSIIVDSAGWKNSLAKQVSLQNAVKYDSILYEIRRAEGVRFLTDWKDEKARNPAALLRRADSLRDTGSTVDAQSAYQTLVDHFFYTKEGKRAVIEIAKIKTEQQMYREAIKSYRRFLIDNTDESKKCNYMFMIGFIYDEYLDKPALAEMNYKWVLKNTPGCELADDAEFMMLHLGEQMAGVDELQAEVKRQGKKVEAEETDTTGLKVEMIPAK